MHLNAPPNVAFPEQPSLYGVAPQAATSAAGGTHLERQLVTDDPTAAQELSGSAAGQEEMQHHIMLGRENDDALMQSCEHDSGASFVPRAVATMSLQ